MLYLALIHHLAITSNVPIDDLVDWFAEISADLVVEFPAPDDVMVKHLLLSKDQVYADCCVDYFDQTLRGRFDIRDRLMLASRTRILYYVTPRERH